MTPAEFRAALAALGLSQTAAAHLMGVRLSTVQRWCQGERETPEPAQRLLWAMQRDPTLIAALREREAA
jgi:DNA-binding transcriptional regulator YiaG